MSYILPKHLDLYLLIISFSLYTKVSFLNILFYIQGIIQLDQMLPISVGSLWESEDLCLLKGRA